MGLWTPASVTEQTKTYVCRVPGCTHPPFPETHQRQFEQHVKACAARNLDSIRQLTEDRRSTFTEPADKEQAAWVRRMAEKVGGTEANKRLRGRKGR